MVNQASKDSRRIDSKPSAIDIDEVQRGHGGEESEISSTLRNPNQTQIIVNPSISHRVVEKNTS